MPIIHYALICIYSIYVYTVYTDECIIQYTEGEWNQHFKGNNPSPKKRFKDNFQHFPADCLYSI